IGVGFALVVDAQFSTRKLQFVQKLFAFSAVEVENGDRLSAGRANLPGKQERAEVISRRHVPFAGTDKNSALFARRNGKFPGTVLERIWRWNERDGRRIAFRTRAPK